MHTRSLLALLLACGSGSDDSTGPSDDPRKDRSTWPAELGGEARPALVFGPSSYDGEAELPLVMMLHGFGVNGAVQDLVYQLTPRVDDYGFVLILPTGTENSDGTPFWNAHEACCNFDGSTVDDSGYLAGLLDEAEAAFPIDPDRIYVMGHSNGGYMSYRMACDHSERIAAIAPLAANTLSPSDCDATTPVSVLHAHGTTDDTIPYGPSGMGMGAEESLRQWTRRAGCDEGTADYVATVSGDETTRTRYPSGCAEGFTGELWRMEGVGHIPGFTDAYRDDTLSWLLARRNLR